MPTLDERTSAALVKEYELMSLSPKEVFDIYKERFENSDKYRWDEEIDDWTDESLWRRNEPLIKLAIAKYGKNREIARSLVNSEDKPLKLAMLRNFNPRSFRGDFPTCLFEINEELNEYLAKCPNEDIYEIFRNPALDRSLMEAFFDQEQVWQYMSEERRMLVARVFGENPLVKIPHDKRFMDGYAEYSHGKLFSAAWKICNLVSVNKGWAITLSSMTEQLLDEGFPFKNDEETLAVIAKWYPTGEDLSEYDSEDKCKKHGYLSTWQTLRKNLAKLIRNNAIKPDNPDIAIRYQYYESVWLSVEGMTAAYARDSVVALNAMMDNERLWRRSETRKVLHDLSWEADKLDEYHGLDNANRFNAYEDRYREQHNSWFIADNFEEESDEISDGDLPVNRRYLYEMLEVVINSNNITQEMLERAAKQLKFILFAVIATLAILVLKLL